MAESDVAIWNWGQLFGPNKFYFKRTSITALIINETMLGIGSDHYFCMVMDCCGTSTSANSWTLFTSKVVGIIC